MKLMLASDIHGLSPATERVLELFTQNGAQWLVILGDVLNHGLCNALPEGYAPTRVVERLSEVAHKVTVVRGNCDGEVDQMLLHFPIAASWWRVSLEKQRLSLTYGHLFGLKNLPALNQDDVLVYGHTHLPAAEQQREISRLSPDSVSIPKGGNPASYGMLDNDVSSVITLNGQSIVAQVAINL